MGLAHEGLWGAATGFVNPFTIVPLAAHALGRGVADAGLLEASLFAGMNLVQLGAAFALPARFCEPRRTALLHAPAVAMTLATAVGLALPLPAGIRWLVLLAGVTGHWVCLGLVVPYWATLSGRNIPGSLLGRYFGWCFSLAGLLGALGGALAAHWAAEGGLAWGYPACFGAAALLQAVSAWVLSRTRPVNPPPKEAPPLGTFLRERLRDFRVGAFWPLFAVLIVLLQVATASTQLFTSFLKDRGLGTADFELLAPALALGGTLGSAWLGHLMDRFGPRWALAAALLPLLAALGALALDAGPWPAALAYAGAGIFNAVFGAVLLTWMLRLAGPDQGPAFTGLYGTLTAPFNFLAPFLIGRLAASSGYGPAFGASAAAALVALLVLALPLPWTAPGPLPGRPSI